MDKKNKNTNADLTKSIFFQLVSYNWLIDNRITFPKTAFILLLYIFRQTLGYRRDSDFLRYSLIQKRTGISKPSLTIYTNWLIANEYINRIDENDCVIGEYEVPRGYRGKLYYSISDYLMNILIENYKKLSEKTNKENE